MHHHCTVEKDLCSVLRARMKMCRTVLSPIDYFSHQSAIDPMGKRCSSTLQHPFETILLDIQNIAVDALLLDFR
jgi:hypothetical protein